MAIRLASPAPGAYDYPLLIKQLLHTPLATASTQEIVYRDRVRYTYREFRERLGRLGNALTKLGVGSGTTVAVMDWDSHRYLECYFTIPMLGAVLQTVNVRLSPQQILFTLQDSRAEVILVNRDFVPLLAAIRPQLDGLKAVVLLDDGPEPLGRPDWIGADYESLTASAAADCDFPDFDEHAIATLFHTTGTTGLPKGVCFSHRQIVLLALAGLGALASPAYGQCLRHGDVYMPMTPMFHVHAWATPYLATLLGLKQVYPGRYVAGELLALRAKEGVTFSHCVPTILQMLLSAAAPAGSDLSGWKIVIGGSALAPSLAEAALRAGIDIFAGYGLSETGPTLTVARLRDAPQTLSRQSELEERCCAGLPIPLVDLQIVDANGRRVPRDARTFGEIVVRAPWTTLGYVGDAEASAALWQDGYLHTQDIGTLDESGHLRITDRMKDVIKSGGEWVSSLQLEELIAKHPWVAEVAVVAVPDEHWGERPIALIVPRSADNFALTAEVRRLVQEHVDDASLSKYAMPDRIILVEALERTSVGKIDKRILRERYAS
ncbi:MAG: Medium-chain-fatty-acid--CoA ligase [Gammaproteobacteria bacterium]|nr:Medium-chain-fatty-acid--CoA ligase [Gammaproteobacteria bacterium]